MQSPPNLDEHVKHLRKIHFSLVVICLALISAVVLSKSPDADRALDQLSEIQSVLTAWQSERSWLTEAFGDALSDIPISHQRWFVSVPAGSHLWPESSILELLPGGPFYRLDTKIWPDLHREGGAKVVPLSEFAEVWEHLISVRGLIAHAASERGEFWGEMYPPEEIYLDEVVHLSPELAAGTVSKTLTGSFTFDGLLSELSDDAEQSREELKLWLSFNVGVRGRFHEYVHIPVSARTASFDGQAALKKAFKVAESWHQGKFDESFSSLARITKLYRNLTLEEIRAVLESERDRAGEKVELIGVKVPIRQVVSLGITVLVGGLLFLLLHLEDLRKHLKSCPLGSIPWIALYPEWLPRAMTVASAVVLPAGVLLLLVASGLDSDPGSPAGKETGGPWGFEPLRIALYLSGAVGLVVSLAVWRSLSRVLHAVSDSGEG